MSLIRPLSDPPDDAVLREAAGVIQDGGVLAVPTESFYALAVAVRNALAIERIKEMKGRADDKPIPVLIGDRGQLGALVRSIPPAAAILMEAFWPGALTLTFPIAPGLSGLLAGQKGAVGIRQPGHPPLLAVLQRTGPLTGTSANRSGEPPADSVVQVLSVFGPSIDLILDGGRTAGGLPSTVIDTVESVRMVREGPIGRDQINAALRRAGMKLAAG